jgi:disulfide bond formation protein DsbB
MPRALDTLALSGICGVLLVAFYYQFALGELPCPLCALQRVGFIIAGVGLLLNLRAGYSPAHYGLVLLTSVVAGSASLRQIALHVVPGSGSYGSALFGLHFYTWAFVGYGALIVYTGIALLLEGSRPARDLAHDRSRGQRPAAAAVCWLFVALTAANMLALALECGLGPCPDNPTTYLWWPRGG